VVDARTKSSDSILSLKRLKENNSPLPLPEKEFDPSPK